MSYLLLTSRRIMAATSLHNGVSSDCSRVLLRWKATDLSTLPLKKLPKIELEPGETLPLENKKKLFLRVYKTLVVNPDGSSYYAESPDPYPITFLPLDLSKLSEEELAERRRAHLPPRKVQKDSGHGFTEEEMDVKKDYEQLI